MFATKPYNRLAAVEYAQRWALERNPLFSNYTGIGGDCTNFVSQCIFAGSCVMNGTPTFGWYYRNANDYAPAWTGVPYLYNFLTTNMENGPYATEVTAEEAEVGDIVQFGQGDGSYYHTLLLTGTENGVFLVSAHTNDALDRRLDTYTFDRARYLHILGVRFEIENDDCCFEGMMSGTSIFPSAAQRRALSCIRCGTRSSIFDGLIRSPDTERSANGLQTDMQEESQE